MKLCNVIADDPAGEMGAKLLYLLLSHVTYAMSPHGRVCYSYCTKLSTLEVIRNTFFNEYKIEFLIV